MQNNKNKSGLTLVELIVSAMLFMSLVVVIAMTLSTIFESYSKTQSNTSLEQDAQYITARLNYAATQSDSTILVYQDRLDDFATSDLARQPTNATITSGGVSSQVGVAGTYTSPPFDLGTNKTVGTFTVTKTPANTNLIGFKIVQGPIKYESCDVSVPDLVNSLDFVGPLNLPSTDSNYATDLYTAETFDVNASGAQSRCLRYKAYFSSSGTTLSLDKVIVRSK